MATDMLTSMEDQTYAVTLDQFVGVMDNVHVEGVNSWTLETMVADLTNGKVYLYLFYQFDKPLILDVKEELANPSPEGNLSALFPEDVREEARQRYEELQARGQLCNWLAKIWLISVALSFLVFIIAAPAIFKRSWLWLVGLLLLGPVAFLLWLFVVRRKTKGKWVESSHEVVGDLIPVVFFIL